MGRPLSPFEILADYEQRSLAHVAGLPEQLDAPGLWRGVGFRVGRRGLAAGFDEVVEILPMPLVSMVMIVSGPFSSMTESKQNT